MSQRLLVTRPEHDTTTTYLSHYAKQIIKFAEEKGIPVKDFSSGSVKKKAITNFLIKQKPRLLFFNGHGDSDAIEGDKGEIILKEGENDEVLKDKITYARSCFVANSLGKKCASFGEDTCFIGYKFPFKFWFDETRNATPLKDKIAALYLEPSNELIKAILRGKTPRLAFENSKKLMARNMDKILKENGPGALGKLKALWINYVGQEIHGNGEILF